MAEVYIDKFLDEKNSHVDLYVSPDQGYSWKEMKNPVDLTPLSASSTRYNNKPINQYHYKLSLTVDKLEIISYAVIANGGSNWTSGTRYEFAVALVDAYGNESPVSDSYFVDVANATDGIQLRVKFDPNATGYRIYGRMTTQAHLFLYYDSTATATLMEDMIDVQGDMDIKLNKGAAKFPFTESILIDNEYMSYTLNPNGSTNGNGDTEFSLSVNITNTAYHGIENIVGTHRKGTQVLMINDGFLYSGFSYFMCIRYLEIL